MPNTAANRLDCTTSQPPLPSGQYVGASATRVHTRYALSTTPIPERRRSQRSIVRATGTGFRWAFAIRDTSLGLGPHPPGAEAGVSIRPQSDFPRESGMSPIALVTQACDDGGG